MAKVSVIYRAPKGDSKVVEWGPYTFYDGVAIEIECTEENAHMLKKIAANKRHFELSEMAEANPEPEKVTTFDDYTPIEEVVKRGRGRPRKVADDDEGEDAA